MFPLASICFIEIYHLVAAISILIYIVVYSFRFFVEKYFKFGANWIRVI